MIFENVTLEEIRAVAERVGVHIVQQAHRHDDEVKALVRPAVGGRQYRAMTKTGHVKPGLCWHGHYAFMSRLLAEHPGAVMRTWYNRWDYAIFNGGALAWTLQQIKEAEHRDACDCTPEMVEEAMRTPDELRKGGEKNGRRGKGATGRGDGNGVDAAEPRVGRNLRRV